MAKHVLKKFSLILLSLFVVVTATFFLMHAIPGDPFAEEQPLPPEVLKALHRHYKLDQPLSIQYLNYLQSLLHFDLGPSLKYQGRTVQAIIAEGFPISLTLGCEALLLALTAGISLGSLAALNRGKWQDRCVMCFAVLGLSVPSFLLATLLQYLFAIQFSLFPIARWENFASSILPALSLAALPTAFIARLTRSGLADVLEQDYILLAEAKGLSPTQVLFKHALKNALLPVVSYLGPLSAAILTGSFVVEKIFGIPGLGQWFVLSVMDRDYTLILALTIFYSAFLMLCVFLVDLLYCFLDPRIVWKKP